MLTLNDFLFGHSTRYLRSFLTVELLFSLLSHFWAVNTERSFHHLLEAVAYQGGVQTPHRNSEDVGVVLGRMSKKNRRFDFLL